jgi:hypothetical protein
MIEKRVHGLRGFEDDEEDQKKENSFSYPFNPSSIIFIRELLNIHCLRALSLACHRQLW